MTLASRIVRALTKQVFHDQVKRRGDAVWHHDKKNCELCKDIRKVQRCLGNENNKILERLREAESLIGTETTEMFMDSKTLGLTLQKELKMTFLEKFNKARMASCPIVVVRTPDITSTITTIAQDKDNLKAPMVLWDCGRGISPVNQPEGERLVKSLLALTNNDPQPYCSPEETLARIISDSKPQPGQKAGQQIVPRESIIFMANLHRFFHNPVILQQVWNVRNPFKQDSRMLAILCPDVVLPPELANDVLIMDEPLPDAKQLEQIVLDTYEACEPKDAPAKPKPEKISLYVDALSGLAAFPAEQVCAMTISKAGMDLDHLWERKRQTIEQTRGLSIWRGRESFKDVIGLENVKRYHLLRKSGPKRRRGVVFIDEIDKHLAGFGAVGTGDTTTEMVGALLTYMQDIEAEGSLFLGIAGGGKTLIARAIANEWGVPLINFDMSGMKGSLVGESGATIRAANKVITAVTQGDAYYVATCNRIENLPPELRRRFKSATFFFDLLSVQEKEAAWDYYKQKYGLKDKEHPADTGWTASEINNCCYNAWVLNIPLEEAAKYIIPVTQSAGDEILNLRKMADGKFISASREGAYKAPDGLQEPDAPPVLVGAVFAVPQKRNIKVGKNDSNVN